jgi:putative heme-binding domain-containing protein
MFLGPMRSNVREFVEELATIVGSRGDLDELTLVLEAFEEAKDPAPFEMQMAVLNGLTTGLTRRGTHLNAFVREFFVKNPRAMININALFHQAAIDAVRTRKPEFDRLTAIRVLGHAPISVARPALLAILEDREMQSLQIAAIESLLTQPVSDTPVLLLKSWTEYSPAVRRAVIEALTRRPERVNALLDAVADGRIRAVEFDALKTRQLTEHSKPEIRTRARELLKQNIPADRKEVLERYQAALKQPGDAKRGRDVFHKHCATCHRLENVGHAVGPDISDLQRTKTAEALLLDVLNPNAAIDSNFVNYTVTTKSGKSFSGILAAETAGSLTLKRGDNQSDTILRQDIEEITNTGLSLMPDGFEKSISIPEMADLLNYLKNWRYLDDPKRK